MINTGSSLKKHHPVARDILTQINYREMFRDYVGNQLALLWKNKVVWSDRASAERCALNIKEAMRVYLALSGIMSLDKEELAYDIKAARKISDIIIQGYKASERYYNA